MDKFTDNVFKSISDSRVRDYLKTLIHTAVSDAVKDLIANVINPLQSKISTLESEVVKLTARLLEEQERYSKVPNLIVEGIQAQSYADASSSQRPDTTDSNSKLQETVLDLFKNVLKVNISASDISVAHRLKRGPSSSASRRPPSTIVKFTTLGARNAVFSARRNLKGTRIFINEHLTSKTAELFAKARKLVKKKLEKAFTTNGFLYTVLTNSPQARPVRVSELRELPV